MMGSTFTPTTDYIKHWTLNYLATFIYIMYIYMTIVVTKVIHLTHNIKLYLSEKLGHVHLLSLANCFNLEF